MAGRGLRPGLLHVVARSRTDAFRAMRQQRSAGAQRPSGPAGRQGYAPLRTDDPDDTDRTAVEMAVLQPEVRCSARAEAGREGALLMAVRLVARHSGSMPLRTSALFSRPSVAKWPSWTLGMRSTVRAGSGRGRGRGRGGGRAVARHTSRLCACAQCTGRRWTTRAMQPTAWP